MRPVRRDEDRARQLRRSLTELDDVVLRDGPQADRAACDPSSSSQSSSRERSIPSKPWDSPAGPALNQRSEVAPAVPLPGIKAHSPSMLSG
jgi:hypothetical protein